MALMNARSTQIEWGITSLSTLEIISYCVSAKPLKTSTTRPKSMQGIKLRLFKKRRFGMKSAQDPSL